MYLPTSSIYSGEPLKGNDYVQLFPQIAKAFHIDRLTDSDGKLARLFTSEVGSDISRINQILVRIHREQGNNAYLKNRIRERVAILVTEGITENPVFPSSIVNDILHHTDAISRIEGVDISIDFTEQLTSVDDKLSHTDQDGKVEVEAPNGEMRKIPFLVLYYNSYFLDRISLALEVFLWKNPEANRAVIREFIRGELQDFCSHFPDQENIVLSMAKKEDLFRNVEKIFREGVEKLLK